MEQKNIRQHCPEVESLMGGKMPFATRWGIMLVALVICLIAAGLSLSDGACQQLVKDMVSHIIGLVMLIC